MYFSGAGSLRVICDHVQRTDVTGLDDDTERILALEAEVRRFHDRESEGNRRWVELVDDLRTEAERARDLERRLSECAAERDRAFNEGVEGAADYVAVHGGIWGKDSYDLARGIRSLKRGGKG